MKFAYVWQPDYVLEVFMFSMSLYHPFIYLLVYRAPFCISLTMGAEEITIIGFTRELCCTISRDFNMRECSQINVQSRLELFRAMYVCVHRGICWPDGPVIKTIFVKKNDRTVMDTT